MHLVEVGLGTHSAIVTNPARDTPYRYVRLRGTLLGLYGVDAVESVAVAGGNVCGDGRVGGTESCDDGDVMSEDGCDSGCQVEPGYTCQGTAPSVCTDIDECAEGTDTCEPDEVCVNTPGSFECEAPACAPPRIICDDLCVDPSNDNANCGACGNVCEEGTACAAGVCVGTGPLQITATWSRPGDADLLVTTPTGKLIYYGNEGPSQDTDFGALDADDNMGTGPKNIFWAEGRTPPSGTYHVCMVVADVAPPSSPTAPVTCTIRVRREGQPDLTLTRTYTDGEGLDVCNPEDPNYIGSFTYP